MSSLVSPVYAATQYALLSSLYALPGKFVGGLSGFMVEAIGYPRFFATTALIGLPVALLCTIVWRGQAARALAPRHPPEPAANSEARRLAVAVRDRLCIS